eukprot:4805360-Pleurochrysis_carterae.AAC.2
MHRRGPHENCACKDFLLSKRKARNTLMSRKNCHEARLCASRGARPYLRQPDPISPICGPRRHLLLGLCHMCGRDQHQPRPRPHPLHALPLAPAARRRRNN